MLKAKDETSVKTLMRIIQVVKAVFAEKMDQEAKKKGKNKGKDEEDEVMEDGQEESKVLTNAQKHKKFSQSLQPDEYQRLVHFFANEVPSLALKLCGIKAFPSVDKLLQ